MALRERPDPKYNPCMDDSKVLEPMRAAALALASILVVACSPDGPLGTLGAVATAPITAPVMFFSARLHDRDDFLDRARRNDRPLGPMSPRSQAMAQATLERALRQGRVNQGVYWQNEHDRSGYVAGGVTVLASGHTNDGALCREVLIETVITRRPTDQRVRTFCRSGTRWRVLAGPVESDGG
ncbi:MAG: hypothetical protein OXC11_02655 [Rhodospirillales bacterium]|nr:hypothetical protein [Rhodospirillales bacterium]